MNFEKFPDVLSKNDQKSQIKLSLANEIAYRRWVSNLAGCWPIKTVFEAHLWDNISYLTYRCLKMAVQDEDDVEFEVFKIDLYTSSFSMIVFWIKS
jgi:hypothetical protein